MARSGYFKQTFSLPKDLADRLNELASAPGVTKCAILADALRSWLDRKGSSEVEIRFAKRLDVISHQLARIERNGHIALETHALFILYMLTAIAPIAESDHAARAAGKDRFAAFVKRLGQRLANGRPTLLPDEDR